MDQNAQNSRISLSISRQIQRGVPSISVYLFTKTPLESPALQVLRSLGVTDPDPRRRLFLLSLSPAQILSLPLYPWVLSVRDPAHTSLH